MWKDFKNLWNEFEMYIQKELNFQDHQEPKDVYPTATKNNKQQRRRTIRISLDVKHDKHRFMQYTKTISSTIQLFYASINFLTLNVNNNKSKTLRAIYKHNIVNEK